MGSTVIKYVTSVGNAGINYGGNGTPYDPATIAAIVYVQPYIPFPGDGGTPCLYVSCTTTEIPATLTLLYQSVGDVPTGSYNPNIAGDWNTAMYPLDGLDLDLTSMYDPAWTDGKNIAIVYNLDDYINELDSGSSIGFNPGNLPAAAGGYPKAIMAANATDADNFSFFQNDTFANGTVSGILRTVVLLCTMQSAYGPYPALNFQVQLYDTSNGNQVVSNYRVDPRIKNNG